SFWNWLKVLLSKSTPKILTLLIFTPHAFSYLVSILPFRHASTRNMFKFYILFKHDKIVLIKEKKMKRVITYGTFDLLHYGHVRLLKRAKELGDYLIVGLSTDEFNEFKKHKEAYNTYPERKYILEAIRYVDQVIPEKDWDQKITDVQKYHIDTFVMGDDWKGKFDFLKPYCDVVYLPRTPGISTTKIKEDLK